MSRRDQRMPFAKWVDTHVHYLRAPRLQAIMTLLEERGAQTSRVLRELLACERTRLRALTQAHPSARMGVTIDTVQGDLALLIERGYLQRVDQGDGYEWGGGRRISIWRYGLPTGTL